MKKLFLTLLIILGLTDTASALPNNSYQQNILPFLNQTYDLGSTTPALEWNNVFTKNLTVSGTCTGCGGSGGTFPFTPSANYNSTSTAIGFLNGLFSTASSTFNSTLNLPALSNGGLAVYGGLVSSGATTTAGTGLTYTGNQFNVDLGTSIDISSETNLTAGIGITLTGDDLSIDTSQNIATLSNLTSNGFVKTSGGVGTLSVDTATYLTTVDISANTNLAVTWPVILTGDTLSFGGLATSSAISAASGLLYATGVNTLASISTSSAVSMSITGNAGTVTNGVYTTGAGSVYEVPLTFGTPLIRTTNNIAWVGLATTSQPVSSNLLVSNGGAGVFGVATSTLTPSAPLGGSFVQIGSGGTLTCTGCLTANQSITLTGVVTGTGATAITTAFGSQTAGVLGNSITGNTAPMGTSTLYGASTGGKVLGWDNATAGIAWVATSSSAGGVSYGQTFEVDSLKWISATTTGTYGINANASGETYGYGIGGSLLGYASSTNQNTIFGLGAGGNNATTSATVKSLVAVGLQALWSNTTGSQNVALGTTALRVNTTGGQNTAIGYVALLANVTSSLNTAVGYQALSASTGEHNTAFGANAGVNITTGYDNTFLGQTINTGGNAITTGGGNIGIGYNITFPAVSTNRLLNIGNTLFGGLIATSTSTAAPYPTSGSFSVGSSTPWAKLSVHSNYGDTATTLFAVASSSLSSTSTLFSISNIGQIINSPNVATSSSQGVISPTRYLTLGTATTTAWTASSSVNLIQGVLPFTGTIQKAICNTDAGTLNVDLYHTATHLTLINASTTVGTNTFSSNNTFQYGEILYMVAGTPASSPTTVSCTLSLTETPL